MTASIFVFGSNLGGYHAGGAAAFAVSNHGAIYGQAIGLQGSSYAIPTLDAKFKQLPLHLIEQQVHIFLHFAKTHPKMRFQVTAIGTGIAGFTPSQIAPMFFGAPSNCVLPQEFINVL